MSRSVVFPSIVSAFAITSLHAQAATILDAGFFSEIPHTLITFETDGRGNPVSQTARMPYSEYASSGFTFTPGTLQGVYWANDPAPDSDAAQAIGGSLEMSLIASDNLGDFNIQFSVPVRAFGFWVMHNNTGSGTPTFEAYGSTGFLETASFASNAINGNVGIIDYGFLGIASEEVIMRVHVTGDVAEYDNFRFSGVPEPATLSLLALAGLALLQRRRQLKEAELACIGKGESHHDFNEAG